MRNFVSQWSHVKQWQNFCTEALKKVFSNAKKVASTTIFWHFFWHFFMFELLISNHAVFLVQFEINLHLRVFQKAEIALAKAAHAISAFWKTHSCKLIPNWTQKLYDYLCWLFFGFKYQKLTNTMHNYTIILNDLWLFSNISDFVCFSACCPSHSGQLSVNS